MLCHVILAPAVSQLALEVFPAISGLLGNLSTRRFGATATSTRKMLLPAYDGKIISGEEFLVQSSSVSSSRMHSPQLESSRVCLATLLTLSRVHLQAPFRRHGVLTPIVYQ